MKIYVNQNAARGGNGSKESPFKAINDAAKIAVAGDEIIVAPGIYREYVNPRNAGREDARISYISEEPLKAVITGAELVTDWMPYEGTTYVTRIDNTVFGSYNPYIVEVEGDWYFAPNHIHTGNVYVNDRMFYETQSLEECLEGKVYERSWEPEFSIYKWYTCQDKETNETIIYANFQDLKPSENKVEITVRRNCFMPSEKYISYITLSGFTVCKAATTWAPPAAYQDGMIGAHWSKGWIIEDCDVSGSKCCGISFGNYSQENNDNYFFHKHVKSPTQMERDAVCRAQYDGWTKETVGSHIVRRCHIHHCEQTGIVGRMGCVFSIIEDNHIHNINNMQQLGGAEIAGIKFHAAIDVIFRRNHIHHCSMGIWTDWEAQGTRITRNFLHDNNPPEFIKARPDRFDQDIFVEVGHGPMLIDNNILLSPCSLRVATEGVAMVHNLICGSFVMVGSGVDSVIDGKNQPRYTPYHIPHRTEVLGFMTILHGDDRFYNNIFIQRTPIPEDYLDGWNMERVPSNLEVGTHVWDEYPVYEDWIKQFDIGVKRPDMGKLASAHFGHLPVWSHGNAYLSGAGSFAKETDKFVSSENAYVNLVEKDGEYCLDTNVVELVKDFKVHTICTETLGKAFEPEEYYENPDGTPITFDEDYFGDKRGLNVIPGPFATVEASKARVY
ncbi:MAG: right-handed parallel beta-helix repeat-containing protein [Lachnospiraceae bacterium]|nr:right-handed parallel beta-helix repeat-containing protein [Lachnospiraceae bacterium]MBO7600431.1 right-handed parallel beta-helix repeat-containing protein [Lachnospiraceae bacterium]